MAKIMLIDAAQPEETRVAVMDGKRLDNFDIESASKKQLKGNIYLAKVTRVEPSLQAAFVNYGGNRHGFLPFAEIHPDYYRIPVEDRERLLAEQEELRRELQQEAEAREARELAEAEARAKDQEGAEEVLAEDITADDITPEEVAEVEAGFAKTEAQDRVQDEHDAQEDVQDEESGDDQADGEMAEGEDAGAGEDAELASTESADGELAEGQTAEVDENNAAEGGEQGRGRNRGRGRGRGRGRNRGGRGKGADRPRPEQISEREEDDESGMERLWKRMRRSYKIQEVIKRGQIMLIQVVKEERGNKGAAVTTYITMPGRYCVLMPNSPQSGGVSRKVASHADRKKMRDMLDELQVPEGMSVILRTAGVDRPSEEVKRDLDYLMRVWDRVRDTTMESTAPALIHEEGSLVKRAIRDLYSANISEIIVEGEDGANTAREVMDMMMPDHMDRIRTYNDTVPLFTKYGAEPQIDAIHSNVVTLRSGGYIVINPTEALVSIDINSGRATRERHIEETALKTNLEAAEEVARQLRLRDLGGLVVIDFIDMESRRNNAMVEKRMRDALSGDRARVQIGRISTFGLLELSRQRLRPSLTETHFQTCPHCRGSGMLRTTEALALAVMRAIETAGMEGRASEVQVTVPEPVALFLFNAKRTSIAMMEKRYDITVSIKIAPVIEDDQGFHVDVARSRRAQSLSGIDATVDPDLSDEDEVNDGGEDGIEMQERQPRPENGEGRGEREGGRNRGRRRGRRGGRNRFRDGEAGDDNRGNQGDDDQSQMEASEFQPAPQDDFGDDDIGNRKQDAQGNEFDGNIMGAEAAVRSEGGRNRGRNRGRGGNGGGGRGPRDRGGNGEGRGDRGNRGERGNRGDRGNRGERAPRNEGHIDDNIGNRAPAQETKVAYDSRRPRETQGNEQQPSPDRSFEKVNEFTGDKKKGWWKKLTG